MIFRRRKVEEPVEDQNMPWAELLHLSQMNTLSLAQLTLTIVEDPEVVTAETRDELIAMIMELEYGLARFEEFLV